MLCCDVPQVRQIVSRTKGTCYDPDVSQRAKNVQIEQDQVEEVAQARVNTNVTRANVIPVRSIMKRLDTLRILVQYYSVIDKDRQDIDDLLNRRIYTCSIGVDSESNTKEQAAVIANVSQLCTKVKPKTLSNVI